MTRRRQRRRRLRRTRFGAWPTGPQFASGPAPCTGAGRGHRRGLDGPTMPGPHIKRRSPYLSQPPGRAGGAVGACLARRHTGSSRASWRAREAPGAARRRCADESFTECPRKPAVQAGFRRPFGAESSARPPRRNAGSRPARSAPCQAKSQSPDAGILRLRFAHPHTRTPAHPHTRTPAHPHTRTETKTDENTDNQLMTDPAAAAQRMLCDQTRRSAQLCRCFPTISVFRGIVWNWHAIEK